MQLKGSKTEGNLKAAFAGESQANRRYLYFANKADIEGFNDVSAVFRSTAEGETGHAHGHLEYLEACGDPATGLPVKGANLRKQLKLIQINALLAGDNIIIPASAGVKQIFEMVMWNVAAQTIIWQQGLTSGGTPIVQTKFTGFPALTGFVLGFNGSFEMPHWEIDNLQPLVLNLSVGTEVDGFIRYRVANGTT